MNGNIILFPCPIVDGKIDSLSPESIRMLHKTTHFIVERAKTARHFIKAIQHPISIQALEIHEMTDDAHADFIFLRQVLNGTDIGIISEAGCPGIADPGSVYVAWAHQNGVRVIPHVGPSSILLALISSGFNGQSFVFHGYLSNKKEELISQLRKLELTIQKSKQTQIWMETPYRNGFMIESCIAAFHPNTRLCVACDINATSESILTKKIGEWRIVDLATYHKRPCIFLIGS